MFPGLVVYYTDPAQRLKGRQVEDLSGLSGLSVDDLSVDDLSVDDLSVDGYS